VLGQGRPVVTDQGIDYAAFVYAVVVNVSVAAFFHSNGTGDDSLRHSRLNFCSSSAVENAHLVAVLNSPCISVDWVNP